MIMKKMKLIAMLTIFLMGFGGTAQASFTYTLDIALQAGYSGLTDTNKIGGVAFIVSGGTIPNYSLGSAIPPALGWILESYGGGYYAVYDDYTIGQPSTFNPIVSNGNIITIISDVALGFSSLDFYNMAGASVGAQYFSSAGFQQTAAVPIPAAVWLLGSGLVGLIGLRRRMKK
jgi:hypothetical protein